MEDMNKDEKFFNEYFGSLSDFNLDSEFILKENLFVGNISVKESVHPISIEVEIPISFPYHKLVFWTDSLYGYPHLINSVDPYLNRYNKKKGKSWFCLNTPFAETAELQLNEEIKRLREWIFKFVNADLPPIIKDKNVQEALHLANLYHWENGDELQEHASFFGMTFIGDFAKNSDNFKKLGNLYAFKRTNQHDEFHHYVMEKKGFTDFTIPYIIEDKFCGVELLNSFTAMSEFYHWDKDTQERLLPKFGVKGESSIDTYSPFWEIELDQIIENRHKITIMPEDEKTIDEAIVTLKRWKEKPKKYYLEEIPDEDSPEYEEYMTEMGAEMQAEYEHEKWMYNWHYFALGLNIDNQITWILFWTSRSKNEYDTITYKFGEIELTLQEKKEQHPIKLEVKHLTNTPVYFNFADIIDEEAYFGRGKINNQLSDKRIAIIGAGAIGSELAITLARGGAKEIGIWDSDYVQPGNLCRADYTIDQIGTNKALSLCNTITNISPFCKTKSYSDFYANINYKDQESVIKELDEYDIIFDCTAKNEILHFLSYAIKNKTIISLCITNMAKDLLCITNFYGLNAYEIRKSYLAKIIQDTSNFYRKGIGCFSPTFIALKCEISALLNYAIKDNNTDLAENKIPYSRIYSYYRNGIVSDSLHCYSLGDNSIKLIVSGETILDAQELEDSTDGKISALYGRYSADGTEIYLTHFDKKEKEKQINKKTDGLIEYIGEFRYSTEIDGEYSEDTMKEIIDISKNEAVNTYNPLLALRNTDGSINFYLYIDKILEEMHRL